MKRFFLILAILVSAQSVHAQLGAVQVVGPYQPSAYSPRYVYYNPNGYRYGAYYGGYYGRGYYGGGYGGRFIGGGDGGFRALMYQDAVETGLSRINYSIRSR